MNWISRIFKKCPDCGYKLVKQYNNYFSCVNCDFQYDKESPHYLIHYQHCIFCRKETMCKYLYYEHSKTQDGTKVSCQRCNREFVMSGCLWASGGH